jgi:hypothetical protein
MISSKIEFVDNIEIIPCHKKDSARAYYELLKIIHLR